MIQRTWSRRQETNEEATRQGGAPAPLGAPPTLVGPSQLHRPTSSSYIYPCTPKLTRSTTNPISTAATFCTREIPSRGLFRHSAGGGIDHGGLLHQHQRLSMSCEQFTRDLRVHSYQLDGFFSLFGSQYKVLLDLLGDLFDVTLLRCVCRDPMNCGFMIKSIYEQYLILL